MLEKQYDSAALLLATEKEGPKGVYEEPASDLVDEEVVSQSCRSRCNLRRQHLRQGEHE